MLQEYESNRCLITVLIAGHGETHARVHSDEQRQRWELLHSPHIPALLSVIISWLNYQAWIIPTCRCLEPASILRCVPTRLPPNSQISHLTPMQDLLESWSCKLWKGVFFFPPSTHIFFFFWGGGYQLKLLSYFTTTLEEITASEWAAQIIDSMLKPSLGALSSWPGSCLQCTQGSSELITPSLPLCSSNHLSLSGCTLSFLSPSSPHAIAPTIYHT